MRNQDKLSSERMVTALLDNNSRDLWSEVKRRSASHHNCAAVVDDVQGAENVGNMFSEKYEELYNSVSYA